MFRFPSVPTPTSSASSQNLGDRPDTGLVLMPDILFWQRKRYIDLIVSLAARYRVPTIYPYRFYVAAGGLISYGMGQWTILFSTGANLRRSHFSRAPSLPICQSKLPTRFETGRQPERPPRRSALKCRADAARSRRRGGRIETAFLLASALGGDAVR